MDDFNVSSLHESKNEWGARLLTIVTPHIIDGLKSIFEEAVKLCRDNNEMDKYLMTFQNFITRIPKWNSNIIETEKNRIVERSGCGYLEDLVTCVHIIQLKLLSAIRVGQKQKKIDITIPKLDDFIHKIYINVARKIYKNVYLFELNIPPLQTQKHHRELEIIVQECILNTVRDSIPVEAILQAYMDETIEEHVVEEIKEQEIEDPNKDAKNDSPTQVISETKDSEVNSKEAETPRQLESDPVTAILEQNKLEAELAFPSLSNEGESSSFGSSSKLSFSDVDYAADSENNVQVVDAPKNFERLDEISAMRNAQRKMEEDEDENENVRLQIFDQDVTLDSLDVHNIEFPELRLEPDLLLDDVEVLA
ncbi:MAG: hypothetical protein EBY20_00355 [Alphaproteobacteria bacterium]|uniref:Uncharacterized protein n=1 Tax=viral metagenome TaxID=1070528 RepID=A0A6C0HQI0_9ZZZZ|nr:hypothetical protein [Alphaproteobacteria bacterium]